MSLLRLYGSLYWTRSAADALCLVFNALPSTVFPEHVRCVLLFLIPCGRSFRCAGYDVRTFRCTPSGSGGDSRCSGRSYVRCVWAQAPERRQKDTLLFAVQAGSQSHPMPGRPARESQVLHGRTVRKQQVCVQVAVSSVILFFLFCIVSKRVPLLIWSLARLGSHRSSSAHVSFCVLVTVPFFFSLPAARSDPRWVTTPRRLHSTQRCSLRT